MVEFTGKLKTMRINRNLTQKQLAEQLGVAKSVVSYYESGDRFPSYDVLVRLARIFHVSTDYLLGVEHDRVLDVSELNDEQIAALENLISVMQRNGWV